MLSLKARRAIIRRRVKYGWPVTQICAHFNVNHGRPNKKLMPIDEEGIIRVGTQ